jgi:hypothetical protein
MMNYLFSGYYQTEDKRGKKGAHFTWDNPGAPLKAFGVEIPNLSENAANISLGYNDDGSQRYLKLGKAYREPFAWLQSPIETLGGKTSLIMRQIAVQLGKHEPGSGFTVIDPKASAGTQALQRAAEATELFMPFSARQLQQRIGHAVAPETFPAPAGAEPFLGQPTVKGMSFSKAVNAYGDAVESGRDPTSILEAARINRIDPDAIKREYLRKLRAKRKRALGLPARRAAAPPTERGLDLGAYFGR